MVRQKSKGFTLIELMIVISIIGILATIAIPSFKKYQQKARISEAYIGISNMNKAQKTFHTMNGYFVPDGVKNVEVFSQLSATGNYQFHRDTGNWKSGAPFAEDTRVYFIYQSKVGVYDNTGTYTGTNPDHAETTDTLMKGNGSGVSCFTGGGAQGSVDITAVDFGAPAAPSGDYDFVYLMAWSRLDSSQSVDMLVGGSGGGTQSCYYVTQFIDVGNGSLDYRQTPIIEYGIDPNY